jgi:hypothetical protein
MRSRIALLYATSAAILGVCSGCLTYGPDPSGTTTTLSPGADQWIKIDWDAVPRPDGTVRLEGFVNNTYGSAARLQLLAQARDASGNVIAQKLWWLGIIGGFGRVSYRISGLPSASSYSVTVWSYTRIESDERIFFLR